MLDTHARDEQSLLQFITRVCDWLALHGGPKERFAKVLDRVGFDQFHREVTQPWQQHCAG